MSIDRLLRESNPPAGMLASPVPQYEDVSTGHPGVVKGRNGAPFAELIGPNGQPISASHPLEVRVRELESELQELRQLFADGTAKMQLTGSIVSFYPTRPFSVSAVMSPLAAGATQEIANVTSACIIESITMTVQKNDDDTHLRLDRYRDDGTGVPYW